MNNRIFKGFVPPHDLTLPNNPPTIIPGISKNELIALELVRAWCSQSCGMPAKFSMVFDRYIEARNRLNEEGSGE